MPEKDEDIRLTCMRKLQSTAADSETWDLHFAACLITPSENTDVPHQTHHTEVQWLWLGLHHIGDVQYGY